MFVLSIALTMAAADQVNFASCAYSGSWVRCGGVAPSGGVDAGVLFPGGGVQPGGIGRGLRYLLVGGEGGVAGIHVV